MANTKRKKAQADKAIVALGILLSNEQNLIGRAILNDEQLLEAGISLVADVLHFFKREVKDPVKTVVIAGIEKFKKEEQRDKDT